MELPWGKMLPARRADNSAVLAVPNVKVRKEAQHSIPPLSHHDLLRESFTFTGGLSTFPEKNMNS